MSEKNKEMKTEDLIASLEEKGIKLWTDNGKLRYSAPQGVMNSDIVQLLKKNKENILESTVVLLAISIWSLNTTT